MEARAEMEGGIVVLFSEELWALESREGGEGGRVVRFVSYVFLLVALVGFSLSLSAQISVAFGLDMFLLCGESLAFSYVLRATSEAGEARSPASDIVQDRRRTARREEPWSREKKRSAEEIDTELGLI